MNKEVNFSRFVGIAVLIISIWIVALALMSAVMKKENNDNHINVDKGLDTTLSTPKSNIIKNSVVIDKEITTENGVAIVKVRLPKINVETKITEDINDRIYAIYKEKYYQISKNSNIQKIDIDYVYEYLDNDTIVEITVVTKTTINDNVDEVKNKFTYDLNKDREIIQ